MTYRSVEETMKKRKKDSLKTGGGLARTQPPATRSWRLNKSQPAWSGLSWQSHARSERKEERTEKGKKVSASRIAYFFTLSYITTNIPTVKSCLSRTKRRKQLPVHILLLIFIQWKSRRRRKRKEVAQQKCLSSCRYSKGRKKKKKAVQHEKSVLETNSKNVCIVVTWRRRRRNGEFVRPIQPYLPACCLS